MSLNKEKYTKIIKLICAIKLFHCSAANFFGCLPWARLSLWINKLCNWSTSLGAACTTKIFMSPWTSMAVSLSDFWPARSAVMPGHTIMFKTNLCVPVALATNRDSSSLSFNRNSPRPLSCQLLLIWKTRSGKNYLMIRNFDNLSCMYCNLKNFAVLDKRF